ncbi:scramblase [Nakamurella antarctica]|uniref:Scramblase n=1 Tax=Nakamurella antarctica TaxID=1902245 RepID=A0A3G8ZI67_9ACTN|nr:phospholipid scramblase-related protein [Nakamurella antarctica]AZI57079.1 scramblase [Nakamurella antarctica]
MTYPPPIPGPDDPNSPYYRPPHLPPPGASAPQPPPAPSGYQQTSYSEPSTTGYPQRPAPAYGQQPYPAQDPATWQTPDLDRHTAESVRNQARQATGGAGATGGGTLFSESVLVVSQRTKLIELNNEYRVFGGSGAPIGTVVQVGQSTLKKVVRFLGEYDQFFTHTLEVRELSGQPVMKLTRPRKVFKSRLLIEYPNGAPIGELVQQNVFGKIRFDMVSGGQSIGSINAENWRAWNFAILDSSGREIARITKNFEGVMRTLFTTADNYVVQIHYPLPAVLHQMVVAAALCVDTALKQDSRGFN